MNYYEPNESLEQLELQEKILNTAIDVQALLRIFIDKNIITKEEINEYREEVRNSSKYKNSLDYIKRQKQGFQTGKDNPTEYLKSLFNAKMNGDIK